MMKNAPLISCEKITNNPHFLDEENQITPEMRYERKIGRNEL